MNPIADAYMAACRLELDALKPGNVHRHAEGHGMTCADFEISAEASAPAIARRGARVGARILEAVTATRTAVGQNTNLGIVLLCAPLAAATERGVTISQVLEALDTDDARDAFAAITLARPGGLGATERHDVREAPTVTLREAMQAAADRDLVARQYADGFAEIFGLGLSTWRAARKQGLDAADSATEIYLAFLSGWPDTHIARKFGAATAESVRREAVALARSDQRTSRRDRLLEWDADLKLRGLNPGACADLTVATLFAALLPA